MCVWRWWGYVPCWVVLCKERGRLTDEKLYGRPCALCKLDLLVAMTVILVASGNVDNFWMPTAI
jgi:hypothetical protein